MLSGEDADRREQRQLSQDGAIFPTSWELLAPYLAEFTGTFILTLTFMCNSSENINDQTWAVTSNAFMMMCMIYSFGHVTGATFNPSVCIALWLSGRYQTKVAAKICLIQILGAMCAGVIFSEAKISAISIGPKEGYTWGDTLAVESLYTGLICFVYLNCAASMKNNPPGDWNGFLGLAVGFCFIAGGYAAQEVNTTVFNSAISMGLVIVDTKTSTFSWTCVGYFFYDFLGAFIGAGLFRVVRPQESFRQLDLDDGRTLETDTTMSSCVAAELIGTFYVVLTKALNRLDVSDTVGAEAWSVGAVIAAVVYSLKDVSGAYFNPAITASVVASRRGLLDWHVGLLYAGVQIFAGILASSTYACIHKGTAIQLQFGTSFSEGAAAMGELLFSLLASYAVLTTGNPARKVFARSDNERDGQVTRTKHNNIVGLAYGACHIVGGFSVGNISGSILNPAVCLGFSGLSVLTSGLHDLVVQYVMYEIIGGLMATVLFFITHSHLYREEKTAAESLG